MIKEIGRTEFIRHLSLDSDLEQFVGKELEWFSNMAGNILGTIAFEGRKRGRIYIILRRNPTGRFQVLSVICDFYNRRAARIDFLRAMVVADEDEKDVCLSTE